jgi:hypothetical protein
MFALQLTIAIAIFGFAISRAEMTALFIIIPFSSYLLCGRIVALHFGTVRVAEYIREELSDRVPGGLQWEKWLIEHPDDRNRRPHFLGSVLPLLLTFVGSSVLALGVSFGYVYIRDGVGIFPRVGLIVVWLVGLGAGCLSTWLILLMTGRVQTISWRRAGLF